MSSHGIPSVRATDRLEVPCLQLFDFLTEREQVVLAELMEGHSAVEIVNRGIRLDLDRSLTDQGDTQQARRELPAGRCCNGTTCWVVPQHPSGKLSDRLG